MRYENNRLQQMRGFYHAATAKSMSRAAVAMSLSQPTVSLQIQALELQLKTKLFERRGPNIRLTRDGETLLELVRPLVEGVDQLLKRISPLCAKMLLVVLSALQPVVPHCNTSCQSTSSPSFASIPKSIFDFTT